MGSEGVGGWVDEAAVFERRDREIRNLKLMGVNVDGGMSFDAEYAEARASLPTMAPSDTPCAQIPCPSFEEVTVFVTPYLEIAERPLWYGADWVRCLSCHSWVMPAEGGSPAEVLEHAEEIHECVVAGRRS